jgi:hypothetical protein
MLRLPVILDQGWLSNDMGHHVVAKPELYYLEAAWQPETAGLPFSVTLLF